MVHKCPMCRFQPLPGGKDNDLCCPECGWELATTKMVVEQIF